MQEMMLDASLAFTAQLELAPDLDTRAGQTWRRELLAAWYAQEAERNFWSFARAWAPARAKMHRALNAVENADAEEHTAWGRAETDPCERGTVGCSVLHTDDTECETW
jgi:hypothetical protein